MKRNCPYCKEPARISITGASPQATYSCGTIHYASHHLVDKRSAGCYARAEGGQEAVDRLNAIGRQNAPDWMTQ